MHGAICGTSGAAWWHVVRAFHRSLLGCNPLTTRCVHFIVDGSSNFNGWHAGTTARWRGGVRRGSVFLDGMYGHGSWSVMVEWCAFLVLVLSCLDRGWRSHKSDAASCVECVCSSVTCFGLGVFCIVHAPAQEVHCAYERRNSYSAVRCRVRVWGRAEMQSYA